MTKNSTESGGLTNIDCEREIHFQGVNSANSYFLLAKEKKKKKFENAKRDVLHVSQLRSRETFQLHVNWKRDQRAVSKSP